MTSRTHRLLATGILATLAAVGCAPSTSTTGTDSASGTSNAAGKP